MRSTWIAPRTQEQLTVTAARRGDGGPVLRRAVAGRPAAVLALQRQAGNRAVAALLQPRRSQALARCSGRCTCGGRCAEDDELLDERLFKPVLARSQESSPPAPRQRTVRRAPLPVLQRQCGGRPLPPCPTGYVSKPSDPGIGSTLGLWIGLAYRRDLGIETYMLIDHWVYGRGGKVGTIGQALTTRDPLVAGALLSRPDWGRYRNRVDILDSDRDHVYEIKPARGAGAGPAQLAGYLTDLRGFAQVAPAEQGGRPRNWQPGPWEPDEFDYLRPMPGAFGETCFLCIWRDPQNAGVLIYDLLCCRPEVPPPVWVPKEVVDKLLQGAKDLLNRLGGAIDDLGPFGKVVGAIALVVLAAAAIYFELPAAILAAIARFFGIMLPALFEWLGVGILRAGAAVTALIAGTARASAAPSSKPRPSRDPAKAPPDTAAQPLTPAMIPQLLTQGIEILRQIERAKSKDPRATEIHKLAESLRERAQAYKEPPKAPSEKTKPATNAAAPPSGGARWIPRDEDFCLLEPATHGNLVDAYVWARYPEAWGGRWGGMPAKLKVVSRARDSVELEFVDDFLGPYGVPHGRRFTWTQAARDRCAKDMPQLASR